MKVSEIRDGLEELERKGYKIPIDSIIVDNLKDHIMRCVEKYNVYHVDYRQEFHTGIHDRLKDFDELEDEIKTFFGQFDVNYRIKQLLLSIRWNVSRSSQLPDYHDKRKMLERSGKSRLLELYPDKIIINLSVTKENYPPDSWTVHSHFEQIRNLKEFFRYVLRATLDLSYIKYTMNGADFKSYLDNGFTVRLFKNGKVEIITADMKAIRQINDLISNHFQNTDILIRR